jgi:flagellar basal body-associated protein FliL
MARGQKNIKFGRIVIRLFFFVLLCLAGFVLIYNNREYLPIFNNRTSTKPLTIGDTVEGEVTLPESNEVPANVVTISETQSDSASWNERRYSFILRDIETTISNEQNFTVRFALELFFNKESLKSELLVKRQSLKIMVQQVLRKQVFTTMHVDTLRPPLTRALNRVLETGTITDMAIQEFSIEEVKNDDTRRYQ